MKRRTFLTLLGLSGLASTSLAIIGAAIAQMQKGKSRLFYVAPNGDDRWSGNLETPNAAKTDGPFATLFKAREKIRELKRQQGGKLKQSITVLIREGTYFLSEPLTFSPEDSGTEDYPIIYKAYENEKPIISGGRPITGWKKQGHLWVVTLPEVKAGKWNFRMLRVDNDLAIRARYPNYDPSNPLTGGWLYVDNRRATQGAFDVSVGNTHLSKLEWNVTVPAAGNYRVWVRYAHHMKAYNGDTMDGRTAMRANNDPPVLLMNLPDTGGFGNFRWALTATIKLTAGKQTITWENIKGGGITLDAFCLTDDPNWNPTTAISIGQGNGETLIRKPKNFLLIHAETYDKVVGRDLIVIPEQSLSDRIPIAPGRFPNWKNWEGAEVHIFMRYNYGNAIIPVTSADRKNYTLLGNFTKGIYFPALGSRFFIENVREALDNPGEWCLDKKTGELLYWSREKQFPNLPVVAPAMSRLFVFQGDAQKESFVEHIYLQGLIFTDTDYTVTDNFLSPTDAAIWLLASRYCVIEDCTFTKLGGYGVRIEQRSQENQIIRNRMAQLGQGGILLLGDTENQSFNNVIAGNDIRDIGKIYKHVGGVFILSGNNNKIAHNHIERSSRYGIYIFSLGNGQYSHNNIVEFNEIIDSSLETADTCAIGTLGRDKQHSGNIIRFNYIRNVVGMGTTASGQIVSPSHTWGIYLDDHSSGTTVYGNIVIGTTLGSLMIHGGKDNLIENNIFINGAKSQIQLSPQDNFMSGNIIKRNIVVYKATNAMLFVSNKQWRPDAIKEFNYNLYWNTDGLNISKTEQAITPAGKWTQWQALGFDRDSSIANPLFIAPETGNFQLKSNSPAFDLDFESIPIERIGIKGFDLKSYQS